MTYGLREMNGRLVELCDECGFDGREDTDLAGRLRAGYSTLVSLLTREGSEHRPSEGTWSGLEYGAHVVEVTTGIINGCRRALDLPEAPEQAELVMTGDAAVAFAAGLAAGDGARPVDLWPFDATVEAACMHLLHDLEHHVLDVRRGLAALGLSLGTDIVTTRR